jgi:hypothetical protein
MIDFLVPLLPILTVIAITMILVAIPLWLVGQLLMWMSGLSREEIDRL